MTAQDRPLALATLVAWLLTAGIGGYMLRTWLVSGGLARHRETRAGTPPPVIFGHMSLALSGLALWCIFVGSQWRPLAWACVGLIAAAIVFGICMVTVWTPYPVLPDPIPPVSPQDPAPPAPADPFAVTDEMIARLLDSPVPPRQRQHLHLLPLIPACHGFLAIATFFLSMLTAIGTR